MPQCKRERNEKNLVVYGLGVLDGCLTFALCGDRRRREGIDVEVFAMKKYGDGNSWTRLFLVSNFRGLDSSDHLVPLRCTRKGLLLMLRNMNDNDILVLAYDVERRSLLLVTPFRYGGSDVDVNVFVESLVSPPNCDWEEEEYTEIFLSGVMKKWKCKPGETRTFTFI